MSPKDIMERATAEWENFPDWFKNLPDYHNCIVVCASNRPEGCLLKKKEWKVDQNW